MKNSTLAWAATAALLFSAPSALAQDGDFEWGGEMRFRTENLDSSGSSNTGRLRITMAKEIDQVVSTFVELQSAGAIGNELGDVSSLHQAYMRMNGFAGDMFDVQAGRMELDYGKGRMLSSYDWDHLGNAWDGLLFQHATDAYSLDVMHVKAVANAGNPIDATTLTGAYYNRMFSGWDTDVYALNRGMAGGDSDMTIGALVEGSVSGFDLEGEYATQSADSGGDSGSLMGFQGTYELSEGMEVGASYTMAADFNVIANRQHWFNGFMNVVGFGGGLGDELNDMGVWGIMPIDGNWKAYASYHMFTDGGTGVGADDLGAEIDLGMFGEIGDSSAFWLGYSMFTDGDNAYQAADDSWFFAQVKLTF